MEEVVGLKSIGEWDARRIRKDLGEHMERFKELIYGDVPRARQALRKLLAGPIRLARLGERRYELAGETSLEALFQGTRASVASPRGFEPLLQP